jgi:hypothetical protein
MTMDRRSAAPIALGGAGLLLVVALAVLLVKVRARSPDPVVDPHDVAAAAARAGEPTPRSASAPSRPPAPAFESPNARAEMDRLEEAEAEAVPPPEVPVTGEAGAATVAGKMIEANRLYDTGDYQGASAVAEEVLAAQPDNVKMLRIGTSSACIMGETDKAKSYYARLPDGDKGRIQRRCKRFGIEL